MRQSLIVAWFEYDEDGNSIDHYEYCELWDDANKRYAELLGLEQCQSVSIASVLKSTDYDQGREQAIPATAAHIAATLCSSDQFKAWYDPDKWHGMVGLMHFIAERATWLEHHVPDEWGEQIDWYLTVDAEVERILRNEPSHADVYVWIN